jgi:hypothetical protein
MTRFGCRLTRPRWLAHAVLAAAIVVGGVRPGAAQDYEPGELSTLPVPGGRWALAELGVPPTIERASAPRLLLQRRFDGPPEQRITDATVSRVQAALDLAARVDAVARTAAPDGVLSLALAKNRQSRDRLRDALEAVGARLQERRNQAVVVLDDGRRGREVQTALAAMGLDVAAAASRLNAGGSATLEVPADRLPLAFAPATWTQVVFEREIPLGGLFAELLRDPRALLLWRGALALDSSTRRFLEATPELIRTLHRDAAPLFAAFSSAVSVRNARVQVGGGGHVPGLWEQLAGESLASPGPFVRRLFTQDGGRLVKFFDLIQALPAPQRDFATGAWIADPGQRLDRFRAPGARHADDPWLLLRGLVIAPTGAGNRLAGPQQRRFWERAFDSLPDDPVRALRGVDDDGPFDAAWIVDRVCNGDAETRHARFRQVLVVPRAFPAPAAADLPGVLMAAHGLAEFPALLLTLERRGLLTPALAGAAVRQAAAVQRIGGRDDRVRALALLQGGVALVDRLAATGALTPGAAERLVSELVEVPLRDSGFGAGIADWLVDDVLAALPPRSPDDVDSALVAELATSSSTETRIQANGTTYAVDWTGAERARLASVRRAQAGVGLGDVVRLVQVMRRVATGPPAQARAREELPLIVELEKRLARPPVPLEISEPIELSRVLPQARRELEAVRGAGDRDHVARAVDRLAQAVEWASMQVLLSLAYTPHLDDPGPAAARSGDPAMRHRFGLQETGEASRRDTPWAVPIEADGSGAAVGSLLGLDHGLAGLALRRPQPAATARPGVVAATADLQTLAVHAALATPRVLGDDTLADLGSALARGRQRVQAARADRGALDALASVGHLSAERRALIGWMAGQEPERVVEMFTLRELVEIGGPAAPPPDAFGPPTAPHDTRLGSEWRAGEPWEPFAGRPALGLLPTIAPDLALRVAELLAQARWPAALYPGVVALAVQDVLEAPAPVVGEDWLEWVRRVRSLPQERLGEWVAALVGLRVLVPAAGVP